MLYLRYFKRWESLRELAGSLEPPSFSYGESSGERNGTPRLEASNCAVGSFLTGGRPFRAWAFRPGPLWTYLKMLAGSPSLWRPTLEIRLESLGRASSW
jgi:hypothetical protein